jgi:hypothetical protein
MVLALSLLQELSELLFLPFPFPLPPLLRVGEGGGGTVGGHGGSYCGGRGGSCCCGGRRPPEGAE